MSEQRQWPHSWSAETCLVQPSWGPDPPRAPLASRTCCIASAPPVLRGPSLQLHQEPEDEACTPAQARCCLPWLPLSRPASHTWHGLGPWDGQVQAPVPQMDVIRSRTNSGEPPPQHQGHGWGPSSFPSPSSPALLGEAGSRQGLLGHITPSSCPLDAAPHSAWAPGDPKRPNATAQLRTRPGGPACRPANLVSPRGQVGSRLGFSCPLPPGQGPQVPHLCVLCRWLRAEWWEMGAWARGSSLEDRELTASLQGRSGHSPVDAPVTRELSFWAPRPAARPSQPSPMGLLPHPDPTSPRTNAPAPRLPW